MKANMIQVTVQPMKMYEGGLKSPTNDSPVRVTIFPDDIPAAAAMGDMDANMDPPDSWWALQSAVTAIASAIMEEE